MTQDIEVINGHTYLVTRDDNNNIVELVARDPIPVTMPPKLFADIGVLIPTLTAGTATSAQQQLALAFILAFLTNQTSV